MPFCRYSDLDHGCDLHVIAAPDGVKIMTATRRIEPEAMPVRPEQPAEATVAERLAWMESVAAYHDAVFAAAREKILSPLAGRTFTFADADEAADFIESSLDVAGFRRPEGLLATLRAYARAA